MRRAILLALFASLLTASLSATAQDNAATRNALPIEENENLELVRIWPSWRSADSFLRISEYFGGNETRNRQTTLRSQPDERAGFYFLIRIKNSGEVLQGTHFELQVIRPDSPQPVTYRFPVAIATGSHAYLLGLTGSDWAGFSDKPAEDTHPVAWVLRLLDTDAQELLRRESFLWAKP